MTTEIKNAMKTCSKCMEPKPLSEFGLRPKSRDGHRGQCKACVAAGKHNNYMANRNDRLAKQRLYHEEHRDKRLAYMSSYDEANKSRRAAYFAEYRERNRPKSQAYFRKHYKTNRAQILRQKKTYRQQNRSKVRAWNNARKARQRNAPVNDFTAQQWEALQAAYQYKCAYCGTKTDLTMDHVVPLSKGGSHTASNILPACMDCNNRKKCGEPPAHQMLLLDVVLSTSL